MCCLAATSGDIYGEFKLANNQNDSHAETNENTHTPQVKQRNNVESHTSSIKETSLENPEPLRNSSQKMKLLANKYCASITPRTVKMKPKERLTASQRKLMEMKMIPFSQKQLHRCLGNACERWHMDELYISVSSVVGLDKCTCLWIS